MSFETGSASSMNDLMNKMSIFAVAAGWVEDQLTLESGATDGKLSLHKAGVFVHFAWHEGDTPNIAMYQSLGFIGSGTDTWLQTDDSGNGTSQNPTAGGTWNVSTERERFIRNIGAGPYTSYHFFEGGGSLEYIHIALEFAPGTYRHFGFGELEKAWDWTGGEYCYGHVQVSSDPALQEILLSSEGTVSSTNADRMATIHAEGLPGQPGTSKWGSFGKLTSLSSSFNDRAGNVQVRFVGGSPAGPIGAQFNNMPSNSGDGFLPLTANAIWYRDVTPAPDNLYFMGFQPDVRTLNMRNFQPKDEITIGADTWIIFPSVRKQNTGDLNESENLGIAYKKIV